MTPTYRDPAASVRCPGCRLDDDCACPDEPVECTGCQLTGWCTCVVEHEPLRLPLAVLLALWCAWLLLCGLVGAR